MTILVTGATGQVGRPTIDALRAAGHDVRGLTRSGGDRTAAVDLIDGTGLADALAGVETIVHAATTNSSRDLTIADNLFAAAKRSDVSHVVLISIVGVDRIPLGIYRDRYRIEERARASEVPLTIQRSTQFHTLIDGIFSGQRFSPVVVAPRSRFQPIAVGEVGARLAALAATGPQGRVDDIGGPEQLTMRQLYESWRRARGGRRPLWQLHLPGRLFAALDAGENLVPGEPYGRETFEAYLAG